MADCCALCKCDVSKGTAKAKRLKLYRDSAEATREGLELFPYQELLWREGVLVERLGYAHKCKNATDKYFEFIQEINAKGKYLVKKLQSVAAFGEPTGRNRSDRRP